MISVGWEFRQRIAEMACFSGTSVGRPLNWGGGAVGRHQLQLMLKLPAASVDEDLGQYTHKWP